jgi:antigen 43
VSTFYNAYQDNSGTLQSRSPAIITIGSNTPADLTNGVTFQIITPYYGFATMTYQGTFTDGSVTGFYATAYFGTLYFTLPPATISGSPSGIQTAIGGWNLNTNQPDVCFLRGTLIATAAGETPVEDLREGDLVATLVNGETILQQVIWVGQRHVTPGQNAADDSYPVRIRAGAFAENLPRRDLLVTSEHCLLTEGHLIPARMLVNGGSITIAREITDFTYYHVELAQHAILLAEGLPAESYLDTGNRSNFANAEITALRPDFALNEAHKNWQQHAAAPLAVDRATVEPVWRALASRAAELDMLPAKPDGFVSTDPDLRLVTASGAEIRPVMVEGAVYTFALPAGTGAATLRSRTARPADVVGPFLDDRRTLGVSVGQISLWAGRRQPVVVDNHLTADLSGWHAPEASGTARWTAGNAALKLDHALPQDQPVLIRIEIVQAGPYLSTADQPAAIAA